MIQPVILCGGAGTRLWPLSRRSLPKQFVPMVGGRSLFDLTLARVEEFVRDESHSGVICVGAEEHRFLIREAMETAAARGTIILEPVARKTTAAIALACLLAEPSQVLLIVPSDHYIPEVNAFAAMLRAARAAAERDSIVVFGVTPTLPSTGYGYLELGEHRANDGGSVARYIEKPDAATAQQLLFSGNVLWNAGIFLCKAETVLGAMERHAPDILAECRKAMAKSTKDGTFVRPCANALSGCRAESFDFAVMERYETATVYPFKGTWSDVGSWTSVAELTPSDEQGNRVLGKGLALQCQGTYIHAPARRVVALGVENLLIIDTPDALLVAAESCAEQVRSVVSALEASNNPEAVEHRKVARPWGWYDSIQDGERFRVKHIFVKRGASLSLQMHHHRAEHWIVVRGTAEVTRGTETFLLTENQSTFIPLGEVHKLHNPGKTDLEMIEVQSGCYLGEDDIVRFEDAYGRVVPVEDAKKVA